MVVYKDKIARQDIYVPVSFSLPNGKNIPSENHTGDIKINHQIKDQSLIIDPPSPPKKHKKKQRFDIDNQTENKRSKRRSKHLLTHRFINQNKNKSNSENMNGKKKTPEHSYEVIFNSFSNMPTNGKITEQSNKNNKSKQDKKQLKKISKQIKRNSSSFYVSEDSEAYECMQGLSNDTESQQIASENNNNIYNNTGKNEPNYIDVDTLHQIKSCLLTDSDHPYTEIQTNHRKPRSNSIQQSAEYNHREFVTILRPRPKERIRKGGSERIPFRDGNYENHSSPFTRKSEHQSEQYINHDLNEILLRKAPLRSRSVPLRSRSMDCLLEIDFESDFTKCSSQYEILPRPQEKSSPPQIPINKDNQTRRYFQNGIKKAESTEDMFPAQITLQKEGMQPKPRPNKLALKTNYTNDQTYTNNEILSPENNLPEYDYVDNIKRSEMKLNFQQQESTYGNFQSPQSNVSTPESETSSLSYADVELKNSKYLTSQEIQKSPRKFFQMKNINEMTTYTLIDVQKSFGVNKAIQNLRTNENQAGDNIERNQKEYLTDLSHKTFSKKSNKVEL